MVMLYQVVMTRAIIRSSPCVINDSITHKPVILRAMGSCKLWEPDGVQARMKVCVTNRIDWSSD